ncbi:MAG: M15 family metallopeptidase [Kofleriaceae bacterium]|nr:M15 family metallopeptidase [Kofleriaceae bacterium]
MNAVESSTPLRRGMRLYVGVVALGALAACKVPAQPVQKNSMVLAPTERGAQADAMPRKSAVDAGQQTGDFVQVAGGESGIVVDMRYAKEDNFVGKVMYPVNRCSLRRPVAAALQRVQAKMRESKLRLLLWDCYRPFSIQEEMWEQYPNARYVARPIRVDGVPKRGSKHNRGAAVDLSLADERGVELEMPTAHDDFSPRAHRGARKGVSEVARANSRILLKAMQEQGFNPIASEWWHFDYAGWQQFPLSAQPL